MAAASSMLAYAFYAMGTLASLDALLTKPPENKLTDTGQAAGGNTQPQAEQIFTAGQPQAKASAVPQSLQIPTDAGASSAANSLALSQAPPPSIAATPPPSTVGQSIVDSAIARPLPTTAAPDASGIGAVLAGLNNAAGAMAQMAPLLGLGGQDNRKSLAMSSPAGGAGGGANIFALPQRNTLAQILASLPRAYNG